MSDGNRRPGLIERLTRALLGDERTDVDFRPPPGPSNDVVSGWRGRPHVPGSTQDRTF